MATKLTAQETKEMLLATAKEMIAKGLVEGTAGNGPNATARALGLQLRSGADQSRHVEVAVRFAGRCVPMDDENANNRPSDNSGPAQVGQRA